MEVRLEEIVYGGMARGNIVYAGRSREIVYGGRSKRNIVYGGKTRGNSVWR